MTEPAYTTTRSQLADALTHLTAEVRLYDHQTANVNAGDMADAILAQLPQAARTFTEYAVAFGDPDPNAPAMPGHRLRVLICDYDEAAGHLEWITGGYVVRREVTRSRWERLSAAAGGATDGPGHGSPYQETSGHAEAVSVDLSAPEERQR